MKRGEKIVHDDENELLIDCKKKFYSVNEQLERQPSRLEWAEASWTRWLHVLCWWWINPILSLGNQRVLTDNDLDDLPHDDKCSTLLNKMFIAHWTSTWNIIIQTFWKRFLSNGLFLLPYMVARISQPLLLREIVLFITNDQKALTKSSSLVGYSYALILFICALVQIFIHQQYFFRSFRTGFAIRNALTSFIYTRLLSVNTATLQQVTTAQTINLVANDVAKFERFAMLFHFIWDAPTEAIIVFILLWWIIGLVPTVCGYVVFLLLIPLQFTYSRYFRHYHEATAASTEKRIQTFEELINGCQIIKMYNWEEPMKKRTLAIRQQEIANIRRTSRLRATNFGIFFAAIPLVGVATVFGAWISGIELTVANIFTALVFYGQIRLPLTRFLPLAIESLNEVIVSVQRIDKFVHSTTTTIKQPLLSDYQGDQNEWQRGTLIVRDASFVWNGPDPCLSSINISIEAGDFVGIIGPVGSGKSSLLAAILGEMNLVSGQVYKSNSSFAYVAQIPWIFPDTLRANVLFGKKLDEQRYSNVLRACCLDIDISVFGPSGDLTIIGEKGVNLSGGQKSRVSLARALYSDADMYLLDDPLAAVDLKVAKQIYARCIGPRGLLSKKTRLLVTHQTQFLTDCHQTIVLEHGRLLTQYRSNDFSMKYENTVSVNDDNDMISASMLDIVEQSIVDSQPITTGETSASGTVSWSVWRKLFTGPPLGWFSLVLSIVLLLLGEVFYDSSNCWFVLQPANSFKISNNQLKFIGVYLFLTITTLVFAIARALYFFYHILNGSDNFHENMLNGLLYTSMRFFESNPAGRIYNRISKDQQTIDDALPAILFDAIQTLIMCIGSIIIIGFINWWVVILVIVLLPIFWVLRRFYLQSNRELKRLENVTRSPIYMLFSLTLNGLTSIHAFGANEDFIKLLLNRVDANTRAYISMLAGTHWFGLRLDLMTIIFLFVTALLSIVLRDSLYPSVVALSLMYSINLSVWFQ